MKERGFRMYGPEVRAVLAGTKTQTRRIVKDATTIEAANAACEVLVRGPMKRIGPSEIGREAVGHMCSINQGPPIEDCIRIFCPYGKPGDRLWVRETTYRRPMLHLLTGEPLDPKYDGGAYSADNESILTQDKVRADLAWWYSKKVCPAIHMPRWASRITLEITEVRVERLNEISEVDARAEGIAYQDDDKEICRGWLSHDGSVLYDTARESFVKLWESINGPGSWAANPWVWVISFRRLP